MNSAVKCECVRVSVCVCLCVCVSGVAQSALHSRVMSLKPPQTAEGRQNVSHQLLNQRKKEGDGEIEGGIEAERNVERYM